MDLGAFSISLSVKHLEASRDFYEKFGFSQMGGGEGYLMMVNGSAVSDCTRGCLRATS